MDRAPDSPPTPPRATLSHSPSISSHSSSSSGESLFGSQAPIPAPLPPAAPRDDEASILAELEAALAANPDLRAPPPASGEWEDFEKLIAENPELANPVGRAKEFYMSKDKWGCGHEGEPTMTEIEREPEESGLLVNEMPGICPQCIDRWKALESGGPTEPAAGSSSFNPPPPASPVTGPPSYGEAQGHALDDRDSDDDRRTGNARLGNLLELDSDVDSLYSSQAGSPDGHPAANGNRR
ncbi:hypothetical protein FQN57_006191 [Myotisia sp. PD_48]|nr:hypothetical protein FQN57_006191 [Myotisia sp. PD_48]